MNVHEVNNPAAAKAPAAQAPAQEGKQVTGKWVFSTHPEVKTIHHKTPPRVGETEISLRGVKATLDISTDALKACNLPSTTPAHVIVKFAKEKKQEWTWTVATTNLNKESDLFRKIYASLPNVLDAYRAQFHKSFSLTENAAKKQKVEIRKHK